MTRKKSQPPRTERRAAHQDLARDDRRDEALRQVAEAVVVVSREAEGVAHPEAERHLGVRVVSAEHQDHRVHEDQADRRAASAESGGT